MNIAFSTAMSGLMAAQSNFNGAAKQLSVAAAKGESIVESVVAVKQAETAHKASAVMARTAAEMTDVLLDITV